MVNEEIAELCRNLAQKALDNGIGLNDVLSCLKCWLIEKAMDKFTTQSEAAKRLKIHRGSIFNFYKDK